MAVNNPLLIRIAAEASRDPRTVRAAIEGRASPMAQAAVEAAAARLGIKLPPIVKRVPNSNDPEAA